MKGNNDIKKILKFSNRKLRESKKTLTEQTVSKLCEKHGYHHGLINHRITNKYIN